MERTFNNREGDKPCYICGEIVAGNEESTWDRSPRKQGKCHITCLAARNIAERVDGNGAAPPKPAPTPQPKPQTSGTATASGSWLDGLAKEILPFIEDRISTKLDRDEVEGIVRETVEKALDGAVLVKTTRIILETKDKDGAVKVQDLGVQHKQFADLLNVCRVRHEDDGTHLNILLTGPAGTGKTRAAQEIAKALDRPYCFTGAINTEYKLLGFIDAQGRVICPAFRKAWTGGGVFLFDEVWRSLPPALMPFNTALSGEWCDFPDGCFKRHPDFICLAADNTYGLGGDSKYIGHKHDASVLNRFVPYRWEIDEDLEEYMTNSLEVSQPMWVREVAGAYPSVPDFLANDPECMYTLHPVESETAPIGVWVDLMSSAGCSLQELENRGIAMLALVMKLRQVRPVTLNICYGAPSNGVGLVMPWPTQPLELATSCAVLCRGELTRLPLMAILRNALGAYIGTGLRTDEEMREFFQIPDGDLVLKAMILDNTLLRTDPLAWVNEQLQKAGALAPAA